MRAALLVFAIGSMVVGASSCGKQSQREDAGADLLGRPPTPAEDPFFYVARPPVEAKAETRGTIGDAGKKSAPTPDAPSDRGSAELRRELSAALAENVELRTKNLELQAKLTERAAKASAEPQCHACVRLCPVQGKCSDDAELVCGWGTGKSRKDAMLRATTECDGALEYIRSSGAYQRVEGKCPVATCE